jgi:P27 family predicted phage terminase small subunit
MAKGRKKLPTNLKVIKGTIRKVRENEKEPQFLILNELPEPPEYFSDYARKIYLETGLQLITNGILTKIDFEIFLAYITELARYKDSQMQLHKLGHILKIDNKPVVNPYLRVSEKSILILLRIACEFGLTPAARSKVNSIQKKYDLGDEFFN